MNMQYVQPDTNAVLHFDTDTIADEEVQVQEEE